MKRLIFILFYLFLYFVLFSLLTTNLNGMNGLLFNIIVDMRYKLYWFFNFYLFLLFILNSINSRSFLHFSTVTESTYNENVIYKPTVPLRINTFIYQNKSNGYTKIFNDNYFYNYNNDCVVPRQRFELLLFLILLLLTE